MVPFKTKRFFLKGVPGLALSFISLVVIVVIVVSSGKRCYRFHSCQLACNDCLNLPE